LHCKIKVRNETRALFMATMPAQYLFKISKVNGIRLG
jgi:hypothetical protein